MNLTPKQILFIQNLMTESSIEKAMKKTRIGKATGYRWLDDADFQKVYRDEKRKLLQHITTSLQNNATMAIETLVEVMRDGEQTGASRVSASKLVLEMAYRGYELEELTERLEKIERSLPQ